MSFDKILDQPTAVRTLRSAIAKSRVAHAYIFVGPAGVGRKLAAGVFARSLNCENFREGNPCEECADCRLIADGKHPDVQTIMPKKGPLRSPSSRSRICFRSRTCAPSEGKSKCL